MLLLVSSERSSKRSQRQKCSQGDEQLDRISGLSRCTRFNPANPESCLTYSHSLFTFAQSKPLESVGGISIHRYDFDFFESDPFKVAGEVFNPFRIVVSHSDSFRQIKNSVDSIFLFVTCVAF